MFSFTKLLHVSGLTGPSPESVAVQNNRQTILSPPICGTVVGLSMYDLQKGISTLKL